LLGCGSGFNNKDIKRYQKEVYSMEAVGINVLSTLRLNKIDFEIRPKNKILLVCLVCIK
jgi:hypothetical protein